MTKSKPKILYLSWSGVSPFQHFVSEIDSVTKKQSEVYLSYNQIQPLNENLKEHHPQDHYFRVKIPFFSKKNIFNLLWVTFLSLIYSIKLLFFLKKQQISFVFCLNFSINSSLFVPTFIRWFFKKKIKYSFIFHEFRQHLGEESKLVQLLLNNEQKSSDFLTFLSPQEQNYYLEFCRQKHIPPKPTLLLEHPSFTIPAKFQRLRTISSNSTPITIGFLGRLNEYKGIDLFCETAQILHNSDPKKFQFKVMGAGEFGEKHAQNSKYIDWDLRRFDDADTLPFINSLDILLLPYREASQSGVLAWANQSGVVVVATPVGEIQTQISKLQNGIISSEISAQSLVSAIKSLLENPNLFQKLSQNSLNEINPKTQPQILSWSDFTQQIYHFFLEAN